jgi:hypothetical protein
VDRHTPGTHQKLPPQHLRFRTGRMTELGNRVREAGSPGRSRPEGSQLCCSCNPRHACVRPCLHVICHRIPGRSALFPGATSEQTDQDRSEENAMAHALVMFVIDRGSTATPVSSRAAAVPARPHPESR